MHSSNLTPSQSSGQSLNQPEHVSLHHAVVPAVQCNSVKIIIDNVDVSIKTCFVRSGRLENKSLHYINSYAVQGSINLTHL